MSWSLTTPCFDCAKNEKCTDRHVIGGAIEAIHQMPVGVGHLGAGNIEMECFEKEEKPQD